MGRKLSEREGPTLQLQSSKDVYSKLLKNSCRLRESWDADDATDFIICAWHLFEDWTKSDENRSLNRTKRNRNKLPTAMNLILDVTRDLANGSKHFQLDPKPARSRRVSEIHDGLEANFYSYCFHESIPGVTLNDGYYFSVRVLHNILLAYFEWVFDDDQPARLFPKGILDSIRYCNIQKREANEVPEIWGRT